MGHVPWRRLVLLLVASGVFALLALPTSAVQAPDPEQVLRDLGIELQRPAKAPLSAAAEPPLEPTPQGDCGPGSRPETGLQGRVSPEDHESGRAAEGFTCNTELVGKYTKPTTLLNTIPGFEDPFGSVGGFKVLRYVDDAGHECAYYDTTLLFPTNIFDALAGVNVLDMSDPSNPVLADRLVTPAMLSPHESLVLSEKRGLLAAVTGNPVSGESVIDIYDVSADCRHPVLRSSTPTGIAGHESGMAPDGRTFYSASAGGGTLVAVDISNPSLPVPLAALDLSSHGLSISNDGNRAYVAGLVGATGDDTSLVILDTSEIQARQPLPQFHEVARLQWESIHIPQNAIPVTIDDHPYLVEIDEFGSLEEVGGGRIIDIGDETAPRVVSNLRLEVHQPENFDEISGDTGASNLLGGYSGHYCNVPGRTDPGIVACSMGVSGLRVFDIRDPEQPREVAYFNAPVLPRINPDGTFPPGASNWALSQPTFAPARGEIWYSDGYAGFFVVKVTNGAWPGAGKGGNGGGGDDDGGGGPGGGDGGTDAGTTAGGEDVEPVAVPGVGAGPSVSGDNDGSLPFTGLAIGVLVVAGLTLLALGVAGRRKARGPGF